MALSRANIQARLAAGFTGKQAEILANLFVDMQGDPTSVAAAFNTLVTKLNADAVENNAKAAFPLTLDTNYVGVTLPTTGI